MLNSNYSSPFAERFSKITEKLGTIPLNAENSRAHRIDTLEQHVNGLEDKFDEAIQNYNKKISNLKEEVFKLQKLLEEDNKAFEFQMDARIKEINNLDNKLTSKLEHEILGRKESEQKLNRYLEEKVNFLKADIAMETKIRSEIIESLNLTLENDLPKLFDLVKQEANEREECDNLTLRKTADEIKKLNEAVTSQKKNREESESSIFEMLKDLVNRVKNEIDEERKEREQSQETLLGLLEDACNKLCSTAQQWNNTTFSHFLLNK